MQKPTESKNIVTSMRLPQPTRQQIDELAALWNVSLANVVTIAIDRMHREEIKTMNSQPTTVTLKFVAQSGHAWEETVDVDDVDATIEQTVATHGDIERVEQLADPNDISGETIWKFE